VDPATSAFPVPDSPLIPTALETGRLNLRPFRHEDWRALHAYYSDADATRYTVGRAFTEAESWRAMAGMAGHWMLRGFGPYCLEEKASGSVLGVAGLWYPNDWPEPEIKWALVRPHWGRGFASEAARAVQSAAARHLPDLHLISLIHEDNEPSMRLAEAVGAKCERTMDFRGSTARIYRHPHPSSLRVQAGVQGEAVPPGKPESHAPG
jgi:RimJ/RimL family protein N-acetyltransferase